MHRNRVIVAATLAALCAVASAAESPLLQSPDGRSVDWRQWLAEFPATTVVLLWSSWVPGADRAAAAAGELAMRCGARGLRFVVVDVQEPADDARATLDRLAVPWLSDRHGALLKHYRVTTLPALLVLDSGDRLLARLEPTVEALDAWEAP